MDFQLSQSIHCHHARRTKMRVKYLIIHLIIASTLLLTLSACVASLPETLGQRDTLFQAETLSALNAGVFDGDLSIGELKRHGDFGLGTFNALDGEMVVLDGQVYQMREDGLPTLASDTTLTPFAAVTFFEVDQTLTVEDIEDCSQLQAQIDSALPSLDAPYAIKVSGEFSYLQVRVPQTQSAPYPTLTEALATQILYESEAISGTLVGFRLPEYLAGANSAGYHFHFISDDKQHGGHVLACEADVLTVEVDTIDRIYMDITPGTAAMP
jgi:acetolactate decarboxylase